ncbi:MAG: TetR/AcrR family transcriptional regulator [Syntrophomonadaceae bacterium]|nr:TetR/AcrR family transcriptional regulator [Syntrophomonadaceae bacterium]MDD3024431.1 TetR/AcrR family transcriptional regulator [Syntrophomonadaceae bacterium]
MARNKLSPDERRREIMLAAQKLFSSKGIKATSVSDIVKVVGVAQGTFYWYFKSKEEVIKAVAQEYAREYFASQIDIVKNPGLSALEKMRLIWEDSLSKYADNISLINYMHSEKNREMHGQLAEENMGILFPLMADIIRQGMEEEVFLVQYPEETTMIFVAGLQGAHLLFDASLDQTMFERRIKIVTDFFLKGLGCTDHSFVDRIRIPVIMPLE